jgi:Co/Zn/Cd efflux system component
LTGSQVKGKDRVIYITPSFQLIALTTFTSSWRWTLNVRAARWHVLGDLLGSLSALAAGVLALAGVWPAADPVLALGIAALLLVAVLRLVREAYDVLRVSPRG